MADSYSQIYIHVTFAVKGRQRLLSKAWRDEVFRYIVGITNNKKQTMLAINGVEDHMHFLLWMRPTVLLSDVIRDIKANSSKFINEKGWVKGRFEWQAGFGAFSVGHTQVDMVTNYIKSQEEHHRELTFKEEYIHFLEVNGIEYKPEYVFDPE
jgi:putative transposase